MLAVPESKVVAELNHEINSSLAAIRNAIYLASLNSNNPEVQHYLQIADEEVASIARALRGARAMAAAAPIPRAA
jgi:signal transduction histidine kinase